MHALSVHVDQCVESERPKLSALVRRSHHTVDRCRWYTRNDLGTPIIAWIERTNHRRRRQLTLGRLPPIEYETVVVSTTQAAKPNPEVGAES